MFLISFLVYLLALIGISKILSPRMSGLKDFFLAGRRLSVPAIAIAFVSSWFGAGSTMGAMDEAFRSGLSSMWTMAIPSVLSCGFIGFFLARRVRRLDCLTQPEAVEKQYGALGGLFLSGVMLATLTTFIAAELVAAGHLLQMTVHVPPVLGDILILSAIVIYSGIGGFRAVVLTDILQFILLNLGILILFGTVLWLPVHPDLSQSVPNASFSNAFLGLGGHLAMTFTFVLAWSIAPEMWQRMSASRNPEDARKAAILAGSVLMLLYGLVLVIGLFSRMRLPLAAGKNVLVSLALSAPSPILTLLVLIGVLSAISSTIDSSLNVGSLTLTRNIFNRYLFPNASPRQLIWAGRLTTLLIGYPAIILALHYQNIITALWVSADIYASTMFIPLMGLFYVPKSGKWAGILAMGFGAPPVILNFLKDFGHWVLPAWWPGYPYTTLLGIGLSSIGFGLGWLIHRQKNRNHPNERPIEMEPV